MLYPQNGDSFVRIASVTSLSPMYNEWYGVEQVSMAGRKLGRMQFTAVGGRLRHRIAEQNRALCHYGRYIAIRLSTQHFSGPGRSVRSRCVCAHRQ